MNDTKERAKPGPKDRRRQPEFVKVLEEALLSGHSQKRACAIAEGRCAPEGSEARKFFERIELTRTVAVQRGLELIQRGAQTNWQAAAWYLERRHPEEFGRRFFHVEHVGPGAGPIEVAVE